MKERLGGWMKFGGRAGGGGLVHGGDRGVTGLCADNGIGDEGMGRFAEALEKNSTLTSVYLSCECPLRWGRCVVPTCRLGLASHFAKGGGGGSLLHRLHLLSAEGENLERCRVAGHQCTCHSSHSVQVNGLYLNICKETDGLI